MRDLAIRRVHPEVVTINAGKQAWDDDGKEVVGLEFEDNNVNVIVNEKKISIKDSKV